MLLKHDKRLKELAQNLQIQQQSQLNAGSKAIDESHERDSDIKHSNENLSGAVLATLNEKEDVTNYSIQGSNSLHEDYIQVKEELDLLDAPQTTSEVAGQHGEYRNEISHTIASSSILTLSNDQENMLAMRTEQHSNLILATQLMNNANFIVNNPFTFNNNFHAYLLIPVVQIHPNLFIINHAVNGYVGMFYNQIQLNNPFLQNSMFVPQTLYMTPEQHPFSNQALNLVTSENIVSIESHSQQ